MNRPPSFETVFEQECGYVVHSLRRLGVHEADLEDLAQDVFIAVHRRLADYDPSRPIRPWLFAFAFRAASNYRRLARHRRESAFGSAGLESGASAGQETAVFLGERRQQLHRALATLDPKHRAAVILVDLDGVAPAEAAQFLDVPVDTVYSRVRNGRKKLRAALGAGEERHPIGARHG